jgi:hypothetical protein
VVEMRRAAAAKPVKAAWPSLRALCPKEDFKPRHRRLNPTQNLFFWTLKGAGQMMAGR